MVFNIFVEVALGALLGFVVLIGLRALAKYDNKQAAQKRQSTHSC